MRYSEEFKNIVLEDFKTCPYFKTICRKYGLERGTIKTWVRKANLDVELLIETNSRKNIISISKFKKIKVIGWGNLKWLI